MRYDQSIRALKTLLKRGILGSPVLATIELRAIPHWQTFLQNYNRLTLLNLSIHHLDCFRFLFGDPERVFASACPDPRLKHKHRDGIALYILEYANGLRATSWDDVWTGPTRDGALGAPSIQWRVEGSEGCRLGNHRLARLSRGKSQHTQLYQPAAAQLYFSATLERTLVPGCVRGHNGTAHAGCL